jgi:hypothetical protein
VKNKLILFIILATLFFPTSIKADFPILEYKGKGLSTWYNEKGVTSAGHHNIVCDGIDNVVNSEQFGVSAPRDIPFCTKVLICRTDTNICVVVTVVDRRRKDCPNFACFDLWEAPAKELGFGPSFDNKDIGVIEVIYFIQKDI